MKKVVTTLIAGLALSAGAWEYEAKSDEMSGKPVKLATVNSENSLDLSAPYSGHNRGFLFIRNHPKVGLDVFFSVMKGQMMCHQYSKCNVLIKFDEKPAVTFTGYPASDGSTDTAFLREKSKFIELARNSNKIAIQMDFYQNGPQILRFNTDKLNWK